MRPAGACRIAAQLLVLVYGVWVPCGGWQNLTIVRIVL